MVVGSVQMTGVRREGLLQRLLPFPWAPQIDQRHRAVVQCIGQQLHRLRLLPHVGHAHDLCVDHAQLQRHHGHVVWPRIRVILEAAREQSSHRLGHARQPVLFRSGLAVALQHVGRRHPRQPAHTTHEHLKYAHPPGPQIRASRELLLPRLLRRAVFRRHPSVGRPKRAELLGGRSPLESQDLGILLSRPLRLRSGPRETEVGDLRNPVRCHQHVARLHVLVDDALLVRVVQAPCELDGDVQDPCECLLMSSFVEPPRLDPVPQAPTFHVLREYAGDSPEGADVEAAHDVRVQAEVHPGLRLADEVLLVPLRGEVFRTRALHRELEVPGGVTDAVDESHPACRVNLLYLVQPQDDVPDIPLDRDLVLGLLVRSGGR